MQRLQAEIVEVNDEKRSQMRAALGNLLRSRALESRPRLREFLQFVGEAALDGRAAEIKEQAIGVEVFGRPPDYPVHDDTIVRVTARQLRQKIDEYYQTEGSHSPWIIEIPRGTYVPAFRERDVAAAEGAAEAATDPWQAAQSGDGAVSAEVARSSPMARFWTWGGWAAALVMAAVALLLATSTTAVEPAPQQTTLLNLLQTAPGQRVSVVCGDGVVQMIKELTGDAPNVPAYESGAYLQDPALIAAVGKESRLWEALRNRQLVATGSVQALSRLLRAIPEGQVSVRHPREVSVRDFVDDNVILLSGPFANPWVQLFEPKLNFRVVQDANHAVYVRNLAPEAGEVSEYRNREERGRRVNYARLAYMPNLGGGGRVLLIGGPSSPLMELIGSAASNPGFLKQLASRFGVNDPSALPFCEMLLEVEEIAGAPVMTRIVGARRLVAKPEELP